MNNDDDEGTLGDYWRDYREHKKERRDFHQENTTPKDKELLATLPNTNVLRIEDDGSGGEKYVIEIFTDRGFRTVDWWTSTGLWRVRKGRGEGRGVFRLARYFKLQIKENS